jgi:hypothetical protein
MATGPDYCQTSDVTERMYSGSGVTGSIPDDPARDTWIADLIKARSRDFDQAVYGAEQPGIFAPIPAQLLFSGRGEQVLEILPAATIIRVEIDATPGQQVGTWQDYTAEFAKRTIGLKPIRGYPKTSLYRQASFYVDPFGLGNVRLTGIFGIVLPDPSALQPDEAWEDTYLDPLAVNQDFTIAKAATAGGGWWVTPDDVRGAVASWVVQSYQSAKMGLGPQSGPGSGRVTSTKKIPDDVQMVIDTYHGQHNVPKFSLVANDGSDGDGYPRYRWADWQTS